MSNHYLTHSHMMDDIDSRLALWRAVQEILLQTKHLDMPDLTLPELIWSVFKSFHTSWKKEYQQIFPKYLLARPLIGTTELTHITTSPLFTNLSDGETREDVEHHLHLFRAYVGLSNCLK